MVKYYGRARQRTGAVNTKQIGLKMAGCPPTVGKKGTILRYQGVRAPCGGAKFACGLNGASGGQRYTCRFGVNASWAGQQAITDYCQPRPIAALGANGPCVANAPRSAVRAGGVGNIWTPRSQ
jgi:hypothetical protein